MLEWISLRMRFSRDLPREEEEGADSRQIPVVPQQEGGGRPPMFQDEILKRPSCEEGGGSRQPALLPTHSRQMPVVPQPMGGGEPPTFQYYLTGVQDPKPIFKPTEVPELTFMLPVDEINDLQKVDS